VCRHSDLKKKKKFGGEHHTVLFSKGENEG
jgi:hypothetical protein